ncbi:acetate--CoA ligase [Pyrobaculum aerophilum]|uniref:acetate--CoA ligase n=1 Tax=Pyrobaculum aerophilum TaxID=13773 RepID=UPI0023EFA048|nr:acetate--CoA ligase [Pyrobaculum aerophilum]MCX8136890.1 acetate--CoA ligase [Pyrobaculum aerophilum]
MEKLYNKYEVYNRWLQDSDGYWQEFIEKTAGYIYWAKKPEKIFEWNPPNPFKWFVEGYTNAGYSAVDYKLGRFGDKTAYIYINPEASVERRITYGELYKLVCRISVALRAFGVKKGDTILVYMPNSIEAVAVLLAAARIGAVSSTVFAGFSPKAVADRIELVEPKIIFTQDYSLRRGRRIALKENIDEALKLSTWRPQAVVVKRALGEEKEPPMERGRDMWLEEFLEMGKHGNCAPEFVESNEPLFVLPTSGTTAKPKPVVHVHGGYQVWIVHGALLVYGLSSDDVIFNTSDIGWIVGQSYIVFAPTIMGTTSILFDGAIDYPKPDLFWEIIEKYKPTLIWTSPTAARMLMRLGVSHARRHDLSSVKRVVTAGEVLNPEVWRWLYEEAFQKNVPVIDHWWQTELGGPAIGYYYALVKDMPVGLEFMEIKPGSAGVPLPGVEVEVVDERGNAVSAGQKGTLVLKRPFPGMTPTLWKDHKRYMAEYWERYEGKLVYYTGDAAYIDDEGYVWFGGRADEVIKIAGHRIGTIEVESALLTHPAVAEAAVVGVPDPIRGEAIAAFVVLKPSWRPTEELRKELIEHVRKTFGPIAVFAGLEFVNMLPKTRSGKIMRRVLKRLWTGEPIGDISTIEDEASVEEIREAISRLKVVKVSE